MKIERLHKDRIRVILSDIDLRDMNIDSKTLSPGSPGLNRFLGAVLDVVRQETGFSAEDKQIIVEATEHSGCMVLTISKENKSSSGTAVRAHVPYKRGDSTVFEFLSFDNLMDMIKNTHPAYLLGMRLYGYMDKFYLAVPKRRIPAIIYEYSLKSRKSAISESIIAEYGRFLAGGYRLLCMAVGLKKMN